MGQQRPHLTILSSRSYRKFFLRTWNVTFSKQDALICIIYFILQKSENLQFEFVSFVCLKIYHGGHLEYITGIQLAKFELLIDTTSSIYLKVRLKGLAQTFHYNYY
jgi:hypothetical protein